MDFVTSRATAYRDLVALGVRCGKLSLGGNVHGKWHLECFIMNDISNEDAKRAVIAFIRDQWEGSEFSFYKKTGGKKEQFFVSFVSYAL